MERLIIWLVFVLVVLILCWVKPNAARIFLGFFVALHSPSDCLTHQKKNCHRNCTRLRRQLSGRSVLPFAVLPGRTPALLGCQPTLLRRPLMLGQHELGWFHLGQAPRLA